jgi:hypothetical protein
MSRLVDSRSDESRLVETRSDESRLVESSSDGSRLVESRSDESKLVEASLREKVELVIMQHSAARNFDVRMTSRNTWKKFDQR